MFDWDKSRFTIQWLVKPNNHKDLTDWGRGNSVQNLGRNLMLSSRDPVTQGRLELSLTPSARSLSPDHQARAHHQGKYTS